MDSFRDQWDNNDYEYEHDHGSSRISSRASASTVEHTYQTSIPTFKATARAPPTYWEHAPKGGKGLGNFVTSLPGVYVREGSSRNSSGRTIRASQAAADAYDYSAKAPKRSYKSKSRDQPKLPPIPGLENAEEPSQSDVASTVDTMSGFLSHREPLQQSPSREHVPQPPSARSNGARSKAAPRGRQLAISDVDARPSEPDSLMAAITGDPHALHRFTAATADKEDVSFKDDKPGHGLWHTGGFTRMELPESLMPFLRGQERAPGKECGPPAEPDPEEPDAADPAARRDPVPDGLPQWAREMPGSERKFEYSRRSEADNAWLRSVRPTIAPASRRDVALLRSWLEASIAPLAVPKDTELDLAEMQGIATNARALFDIGYYEITRQVAVHCVERGHLMSDLWRSQDALQERIQASYKRELVAKQDKVDELVERNKTLMEKLQEDKVGEAVRVKELELQQANAQINKLKAKNQDLRERIYALDETLVEVEKDSDEEDEDQLP